MNPKQVEDGHSAASDTDTLTPHKLEDEAEESGQASVYVYKRPNENTTDILQPLISQDPRQFRLSGHRVQEVMQIDHALSEHGRAEVFTDSYRYVCMTVYVCVCVLICVHVCVCVYVRMCVHKLQLIPYTKLFPPGN